MQPQRLQGSRVSSAAFRWQTVKASENAVICLFALGSFACGGRVHDEARGNERDPHELLLLDSLGQPAAQVRAMIDGKVVTTNNEGRANLGELPASYDAVVVVGTSVLVYLGLQARSPTIEFPNSYVASNEHGAKVDISRLNTTSERRLYYAVGVTGDDISRQTMGYNSDDQSSWANISWAGPGDVALSAQAFLADIDPITGSVLGYSGFASKVWSNATLQNDVTWTPEFEAPRFESKTIHVELNLPPDVSVGWYSVTLKQISGESGPIGTAYAGPSANIVVPDLPGATFDIFAFLYGPGSDYQVQIHDISAGARVQVEGAKGLTQLTPEDGLTNVTPETEFSWSAQPGSIYELLAFSASDGNPQYDYLVATPSTNARLPDTSALGVPFPSGVDLGWLVRSERGPASVDDYAAAPNRATGTGFSGVRRFTTEP